MNSPLVAITMGHPPKGVPGAQLNASYIRAVQAAGGVPLLIPPQVTAPALERLLQSVSAAVLTGGGDVDPVRYGEEPHPAVAGISGERDQAELALVHFALRSEVPLLAICRGVQVLNVALGGTLVQHIPGEPRDTLPHAVPEPREGPAHDVRIEPGSRLAQLSGGTLLGVNSRHHQAVKEPGEGLVPVAWAPDGIIEGLEMPGRWVVGVQWHPEDMCETSAAARGLFEGLVAAAQSATPAGRHS